MIVRKLVENRIWNPVRAPLRTQTWLVLDPAGTCWWAGYWVREKYRKYKFRSFTGVSDKSRS